MSTIKISIEVDSTDENKMSALFALVCGDRKALDELNVVDAEEVKASAPAKTPTPRPSRAKPKPAPVEEDEEFADEDEKDEAEEDDEEITADDLRALQATKIDKHRPAIAAHYGKLGAKGISSLAPENFQKMFDFLSKLK